MRVGGIPSLSFLVATRLGPDDLFDWRAEDSSVILLRVMDAAVLPQDSDALRVRVETAQAVSGRVDQHWDSEDAMDLRTNNFLSFAGIECRVIGTFYLDQQTGASPGNLVLRFGSDLSNYYPNRGLKVYKPNGAALRAIVNFRDLRVDDDPLAGRTVTIGEVRYASTNRAFQGVSNVAVELVPRDLLGQKSFLAGMTRTGKSNTTKIIIKAVYDLRRLPQQQALRVGQIVFDPNGEYANENTQDASGHGHNPWAVKNIGEHSANDPQGDIVTYGIRAHPHNPNRRMMLLNFYVEENLQTGKEIIDNTLMGDGAKYIQNFRQVRFVPPDASDPGAVTRYQRRVLVYRALLYRADFPAPASVGHSPRSLFSAGFRNALDATQGSPWSGAPPNRPPATPERAAAATILGNPNASWGQLAQAFETVARFIDERNGDYDRLYLLT
jgi:hypothetical protein